MKKLSNLKLEMVDLDEIPDNIDISINLPKKVVPEETKRPPNSKTVALF